MKLTTSLLALVFAATTAVAQSTTTTEKTTTTSGAGSTTTTTTTTGAGTITEYTPGSTFIVKETSGPVNYHYGKSVTYVTKSGKSLSEDEVRTRIKVGVPVSVHYATEGDTRIINRVEIDD